jgi:succinate dehydrogenase / fumarate reductase, flavoprotein subunit
MPQAPSALFHKIFAIDLLMDSDGAGHGPPAWCVEDGSLHRFRANMAIIAAGGCGRVYHSCTADIHVVISSQLSPF